MILQEVFAPVNEVKPLSKDQMDAMDKVREQDDFVLPELEKPEPGFFDGMGEASWKGVASSALKSASALDTVLSSTGMVRAALNNAQIETGYTFDDLDKRQSEIENRLDQDSKELRRRARDDFGVDPTTMGTAAQIIYGVAETIPKAIGYSFLAGPAGGSVLFGADLGISRSQELMDEGVDKNTAINAGLVTFGTAALGMRLPATFGRSRIASATIGAAANTGLTAAEMQGVNWVLQNQNYKELSQKYQLNGIDLATSAIFGGVMGGVLWRSGMNPSRPQTAKERSVPLQERIKRQLREASPDTISDEAIETQAVVQATGIQVMADRAQIDADAIAPEIVRGETSGFYQQISTFKPEQDLVSGIKDYFGTTWDARESGYMMQDGDMLNMSGAHEVSDERTKQSLRGRRVIDHRDVSGTNIRGVSTEQFFENQNIQDQSDYMYNFMARTGAMRMDYASGIAALTRQPTRAQLQMMQRMSYENDGLIVSYYTPEGRIVDEAEWEGPVTQKKLREFFKQAQEKADGGVAGAFAQRAFHGSPHIFEEFSTDHIGTGEGAQAHGWGLYFAGDRKIAEGYRNRLSDRSRQFNQVLDEFEWTDLDPNEQIDYEGLSAALDNGEFSPQTTELLRALEENQWLGFSTPAQAIRAALSDLSSFEATPRLQNAVEAFGDRGRVFEVDIPNEDVLLNEDLSLKDQPQKVKEAVEQIFDKYQKEDSYYYRKSIPEDFSELDENYRSGTFTVVQRLDENRERVFAIFNNEDTVKQRVRLFNEKAEHDNPTKPSDTASGRGIYQMLSRLTGSDRNASIALNNAGVRGITYDGFRDGRCYVVFDDNAIQTIEYYQRQNQANGDALLEIEGSEFAPEIEQAKAGNKAPLIKKAVQFIQTIGNEVPPEDRLSRGTWERSIHNDTLGDIRITTRGARELRGEAIDYPENLVGLPALDAVLQHGKFEGWRPNRKKDKKPNVEAYGKLRADVLIGGEVRRVSVQLERYNNGKAYYFIETEKPSLARNFSQLSTASVEGSPSVANDTINIEVESIEPTTRGSFNPALNRITLTANANISTYSHEMGHWYLENLFQLSRRAVAENTLKEDANILLKEFGIKSVDDWDNLGVDGQRKYQEQFASWVEIYLSEGRAPKPTLQRVFERLGQWLVDLYRELGGVKKAVGDTYKAEVGEELPPVSEEVARVLDRLFANDRAVRKASRVSKSQVAAARMVQANRTNNNNLEEIIAMPNGKEKTRALRDLEKSTKAQLKAIQAMKRGLPVDVSQDVEQMNVDVDHLVEMKGNFGRAYVMGNNDSAVVLQNRDRSDVGSIGQMNAIAANPQYGLVSVSRSYSGAPVVSYGLVPDSAHLGNNDFIVETNGNRVPFMYAVVEAGDVETSNFIDGSTNAGYGNPQRMNAVVGNGRMTALKEAYNRGTANQYRSDLEADTAHGIKPEVIQKMKNPVLVRVINPEDVTTGFISRSNGQQVLALDDVEVAREDAPKIRARAGQYEFDEAGNPTNDTLALFIQDLHDPNALGRLITTDGRPTPEAVRRIRNAVFFEAYQSPELSALFSQEVDPGIRRILNGLANVAPRIIELREQAQELDFSNLLVEAANRIRQARLNPDEGVDFASQMSFLDNPATSAFVEFLDDNANSAAAIARTLNPLIDWAENAAQAADGGLFGGDAEVHVDLADVVGQLRNIINDQRAGAGLEPLPEFDVNALRDQIQTTVDTVAQAVYEVNARIEAETQQAEVDIANEAQALDVQRQQSLAVLDEKSSVDARAQFLMEQNPDQIYRVLDENGMEVQGTLNDLLSQADDEVRQAEIEAAGIGRAVECVLRNGGI